ncbi:MAG: helix-turn-helix transcriptional regulator, partial [Chloroflexi bacterium]|nr:helix-turn-helix transcriptional regulator [Chloroflexota bacterium]
VVALAPVQVNDLARYLKRHRSNTFRSLQVLVSFGLVTRHKEYNKVYYSLPDPLPLPVESPSQPEE